MNYHAAHRREPLAEEEHAEHRRRHRNQQGHEQQVRRTGQLASGSHERVDAHPDEAAPVDTSTGVNSASAISTKKNEPPHRTDNAITSIHSYRFMWVAMGTRVMDQHYAEVLAGNLVARSLICSRTCNSTRQSHGIAKEQISDITSAMRRLPTNKKKTVRVNNETSVPPDGPKLPADKRPTAG